MLVEESITNGPTEVLTHLKLMMWIRLVVRCSPHVQVAGQACPRPSMLSAAQNQPSPSCIRSPPPVEEHCDLWRNPTHCKISWWLWKLQTGLPRRPEVAKRAPSRAKKLWNQPKSTHLAKTQPTWEHWGLPSPSLPCTSSSRPAFQNPLKIRYRADDSFENFQNAIPTHIIQRISTIKTFVND